MNYIEIIIVVAIVIWAIQYIVRHILASFKKDCQSECSNCDYAKNCHRKFK